MREWFREIKKNGYLKRLMIIAVPIMLSNIIAQVQMLIDRIFLGNLDALNMSALGNVTTPIWTTMSFCFSIATGASILISQAVGAADEKNIQLYAGTLIKWNNIVPVFLAIFWFFGGELVFHLMGVSETLMPLCLDYSRIYAPVFLIVGFGSSFSVIMQTSNYTQPLVVYGLVRSGLNVILDWILIFGKFGFPAMGIKGAALATAIAEYTGGILLFIIFVKSKNLNTRPSWKSVMTAKLKPYIVSAKLGINTALEDFAWNLGNLVLIVILNTINDLAAGIYSIIFGIEVLAVVVVGAIGGGTMTLTGEAKGKKDIRQYKGVCLVAYALCAVLGIIVFIVCILFPEQIIGLFTKDVGIITSSTVYLLLISINLYAKSGNIIIGNGIRGSGNTKWMFYTQIFGTIFVISMASLFVFVFKFGITGVFIAVMLDEATRAIINFVKYRSICRDWEKELGNGELQD